FFLENSGIFRFGGGGFFGAQGGIGGRINSAPNDVFFFSRNIGLSSTNEAVPILGGTRLTGRAGPFEIGLLNMQQRALGSSLRTTWKARLISNIPTENGTASFPTRLSRIISQTTWVTHRERVFGDITPIFGEPSGRRTAPFGRSIRTS